MSRHGRILVLLLQQLPAVNIGEDDVEKHQIRGAFAHRIESGPAALGRYDLQGAIVTGQHALK